MNKKGFTLIELLAVIVILGIVIAIAIPGINSVITTSRKNTFISDAKMFADSARLMLNGEEISKPNDSSTGTIISINNLNLNKGGKESSFKSPWNFSKSYVLIHNEGTSQEPVYKYYVTLQDEAGNSIALSEMNNLTKEIVTTNANILTLGTSPLIESSVGSIINISGGTFSQIPNITRVTIYQKGEVAEETTSLIYLNNTPETNATACTIGSKTYTHILDKRDNQTYAVTKIGNQCWFVEDLRYTTPTCLSSEWNTTSPHDACRINGGTGWDQNKVKYQWEVANTVCPTGSHLPSDEEWKTLERTLGMSESEIENQGWRGTDQGQRLKSVQFNGTNTVGFNAKLSGYREWNTGALVLVETNGHWWSSSPSGSSALGRSLRSSDIRVYRSTNSQSVGFSARCLLGQ